MEAIAITHSNKSRQAVFAALQPIFSQSVFDDTSLRQLIATLDQGVKEQYNAETIEKLVKLYIDAQGGDYKPSLELVCEVVDLLVRNSKPRAADEWIEAYKQLEEEASSSLTSEVKANTKAGFANLYSTYLSALSSPTFQTHRFDLTNLLLQQMKQDDIEPTTKVFNALMQILLQSGQLDKIFLLYRVLVAWKEKERTVTSGSGLYPDGMAFVLMFLMLRAIKLTRAPRG